MLLIKLLTFFISTLACQTTTSATNPLDNNEAKNDILLELNNDNNYEPTSYFQEESIEKLFNGHLNFDNYLKYSMNSLKLVAGFDNDLHRYDIKSDLINSFARNLSYSDDLSKYKVRIDTSESSLLKDQSELILMENEKNQALCGTHLDTLIEESQKLYTNFNTFSSSKQLNLINFLDSYGSPSAQLLEGNSMWLGSHEQCHKSKLNISSLVKDGKTSGARYCIANFRSPNWINENNNSENNDDLDLISNRLGSQSIKLGICLPESCNTISILRHKKRIDTLIKINRLNQIPYSSYKLSHLYCLPDENSPLRQFSLSAKLFILSLSSWLTLVIYFSIKYEYSRMMWIMTSKQKGECQSFEQLNKSNCVKIFAFRLSWSKLFESNGQIRSFKLGKVDELNEKDVHSKGIINKVFSLESEHESGIESSDSETNSMSESRIHSGVMLRSSSNPTIKEINMIESLKTSNLLLLNKPKVSTSSKTTLPFEIVNNCQSNNFSINKSSSVVLVNSIQNNKQNQELSEPPSIDLSAIDGIKTLSMVWLISSHTLLFFIRTIANGRDFWSILRDARFMTVMAGIFPVDTFFTITGILTAFLKFNKNDGHAMGKVHYWIEAFVHRYLRFMPLYLIVFWYTRDVSEYIGFGPLWDYATADTSLRSICKQESVIVPLAFQANFKPIDQHCVKPAWYLANDYQYLLITPLFMGLIMKSTILGYSIIAISISISLILQFSTVFYSTEIDDFGALINFKPMFGAYILKNLWKLYVLPYNRIPPYLIGIMTGHLMYSLNKSSIQIQSKQRHHSNNSTKDSGAKYQSQAFLTSLANSQDKISNNVKSNASPVISKSTSTSTATITTATISNNQFENNSGNLFKALGSYLCIKIWTPLLLLISIIYLPLITRIITQEGLVAKFGTSSIIALMRFFWSIAIARLIYICATRFLENNPINRSDSFVIRFLSSPKWKPWSKIGLSALLIQWEIISYLAQSQTGAPNMTITFLFAIVLICIIATYSLALLIYLTIEYPLSQIEQLYIHPVFFHKR